MSEFLDFVLEQLESESGIKAKRMFGGYSISKNGISVALIINDELYLKTDKSNVAEFKAAGSHPFTYNKKGKEITVSNWSAPPEVLEDRDEFIKWINKSYEVALRAKK